MNLEAQLLGEGKNLILLTIIWILQMPEDDSTSFRRIDGAEDITLIL